MARKGFFIVIEGIDGTGKSTQAKMLKEHYEKIGREVVASFEPTKSSEFGKKLRHAMMHSKEPLTFEEELDLFTRDRRWHVENVIEPGLRDGKIVILDRYYFSTAAYQGSRGVISWKEIIKMNEAFAPVPDSIFILDLPVDDALERIDKDNSRGRSYFERKDRQLAIQSIFMQIHESNEYNTFKIDASKPATDVHESIVSRL